MFVFSIVGVLVTLLGIAVFVWALCNKTASTFNGFRVLLFSLAAGISAFGTGCLNSTFEIACLPLIAFIILAIVDACVVYVLEGSDGSIVETLATVDRTLTLLGIIAIIAYSVLAYLI